ncbi:MAG: hypothetical protein CL919_03075 [Deltaproteobacteria bacterium]|nr:hypothetical protein [Deltaproteobacteria bacterium]
MEIAESGSIPRTDFEARRVLDDRDLFRILSVQLEARQPPKNADKPSRWSWRLECGRATRGRWRG